MLDKNEWIDKFAKPFWKKSTEEQDYQLFMRDEPRAMVPDPNYIFSCADGIVLYNTLVKSAQEKIEVKGVPYSVDDILGDETTLDGPCLVCGVFMTFADVHLNRVPVTGVLKYKMIQPIRTLNFTMSFDEEKIFGKKIGPRFRRQDIVNEVGTKVENLYLYNNSRMINTFYVPELDYKYYIVQVADYDVNTILHFSPFQDKLAFQCDRFSFIRWGSQTTMVFPLRKDLNIKPLIPKDMHVKAGLDKVASFL